MSAPRIGCALLAAGSSQRLGQPKQLLSIAGRPLVRHSLLQLQAAEFAGRAVVLGCHAREVGGVLAGERCQLLDNPDWREGIAASIRVASTWASTQRFDALLLAVCDQPRLSPEHLRALCQTYARTRATIASAYSGTRGVPAVFGADWYERLQGLRGDRGAGSLLRRDPSVIALEWPEGAFDIDTRADVEANGLSLTSATE